MRGIISALICALIVAVPGVASADQTKINDPKGDVYLVSQDGSEGSVKQGRVPNTDVQRSVVRHGAAAVGIAVKYVKLKANTSAFISYDAEIRVPHQGVFHALVVVDSSMKSAYVNLTDGHYESVDCPQATAKVHRDEGRVLARVPRACIGSPRWIRFGASALSLKTLTSKKSYVDNALAVGSSLTGKLYAG